MFYRIVAFALVILGFTQVLGSLSWPLDLNSSTVQESAVGLSSVFLGLLNLAYAYEAPDNAKARIVLLGANLLFIGYAITMIVTQLDVTYGYAAVILSVVNSIMVLNHKI